MANINKELQGLTFKDTRSELQKKYRKEIIGISNYNNVDMGVAFEMLSTNATRGGQYKGGGVAENWGEIQTDFNTLTANAFVDISKDSRLQDAYNRTKEVTGQKTNGGSSSGGGSSLGSGSYLGGGSFGGLNLESDTIGTIVGVGVLYMFLSMFRRR